MIFKPFPDNDIMREDRLYIAEIQEKLRALELRAEGSSAVPVDGIFGPATTKAVERFQRRYNLPISGNVDRDTYYKLVEAYNALLARNISESCINGFRPTDGFALRLGDTGDSVFFLNIMLQRLSSFFGGFPSLQAENTYTETTQQIVRELQHRLGLPANGIVNRQAWNRIVDLYNDIMRGAIPKTEVRI